MKEKYPNIIKGVPEEIEKRFDTRKTERSPGMVKIDVYKGPADDPNNFIDGPVVEATKPITGVWKIRLNLAPIGKK